MHLSLANPRSRTLLVAGLAVLGFAACGGEAPAESNLAELEGTVEVLVEDHPEHALTRYFLDTAEGRVELEVPGTAPELRTGARVRVRGTRTGDTLALDAGEGGVSALASAEPGRAALTVAGPPLSNTLGEQRTLVMLVNFQDKPSEQPWTVDQVRAFMSGTVSSYYREASYQQTWVTADVRGWFTLPVSSAGCDQAGIAAYAKQAAAAAGVDVSSYPRLVYVFPTVTACGWSGTATIGGSPSQLWVNGELTLRVVGHELGHNLGLEHSHSLVCSGTSIGSGCSTLEYGDGIDLMGWSPSAHFHAFQKERLGWLNYASSPPITTVSASGDYVIDAYEPAGSGPRALKIRQSIDPTLGTSTWYYVEYRQPIGFDAVLTSAGSMMSAANILNGVVVHSGSEANGGNTQHLLDATPETYDLYTRDPALAAGKSFSDPDAGVTITTLWVDGTRAAVRVSLAAASSCARARPSVSIAPASQAAAAGTALSYRVDVRNDDGAGCAASTLDLAAAVPAGWSGSLAASALTLAPGATGSTTLTVTSPATSTAAAYSLGVTATSRASGDSGAGSASYTVAAPLTVAVATDRSAYTAGSLVGITGRVTSGGRAVANTAVTFTVTKPNGAVVTQTATSDAAGQVSYKLRLQKQRDLPGTYQVRATATSSGASASASTSFQVQ